MVDFLTKRPMLLCGIGCTAISVIGFYFKSVTVFILVFLCTLIIYMLISRKDLQFILILSLMLVAVISTLLGNIKIKSYNSCDGSDSKCIFTVCNVAYEGEGFYLAEVEIIESDLLPKGSMLSVFLKGAKCKIGTRIRGSLKLSSLEGSDYKVSSYSKGIYLSANAGELEFLPEPDAVLSRAEGVRGYIRSTLFSNLEFSEASTLCALIFGDNSYFTDEFYNNVKASGVSHVMVVSGMHLAIFVNLVTELLEKLFYNKYFKALCIVLVVLLLTALCGFTVSMRRAGITYWIMAVALVLGRENTPENTLGAALTFILIFSPFSVFNIALQLSFLSTFGILAIALPITEYLKSREMLKLKFSNTALSAILVSLSALLLTLPVTIYVFGYVSNVAIISNLLISSAVTLCLYLAVAGLVANLFLPFAAEVIFIPCGEVASYINFIINKMGALPFAVTRTPKYTAFIAVFAILFVFWLLLACKKRIDMLKLKEINEKIIKEGGKTLKWQ